MVALLVVAGGIALALGEVVESLAIAVVIVLNAAIGFATERKAASALARLRSDAVQLARVLRDGHERELPARALVPGDVVLVAAGDRVPADGRVFEEALLEVDEAALTGESLPVSKSGGPVADRDAAIADRSSMLYMGTAVTAGRGGCLVTTAGAQTEMGKIGTLLAHVDERRTPLEASSRSSAGPCSSSYSSYVRSSWWPGCSEATGCSSWSRSGSRWRSPRFPRAFGP